MPAAIINTPGGSQQAPLPPPPVSSAPASGPAAANSNPTPTVTTGRRRESRPPSQYDWMVHQNTIRRLYLEERRSLKDVMSIMRRDYGFDAGFKTYKSHMKSWGYRKNISLGDEQADELSTILAHRPAFIEEQGTVAIGDGRIVTRDRLATYLRRRKEYMASTRRSISNGSGSPPSSPPDENTTQMTIAISPPATFYIPETIFTLITQYIRGRWEGTLSNADQFENGRDTSLSTPGSNAFFYMARGVSEVLKEGKLAPALVMMRQAPLAFQQTIAAQQRSLISRVFTSLLALTNHAVALPVDDARQFRAVVRSLIRVGATFAAQQSTGLADPLRRILELVAAADEDQLHAIAERALRVNCGAFDSLVGDGPWSSSHYIQWIAYGQEVDFQTVPRDLEAQFEKTLLAYGQMYGENHPRTTYIRYLYGWCLHYSDEEAGQDPYCNPKIEQIFMHYYRTVPEAARADVKEWLATACKNRNHRDLAEKYMREALDCFSREGKSRTALAVAVSVRLQAWLTEWGEDDKAAEVAQQREGLLEITTIED